MNLLKKIKEKIRNLFTKYWLFSAEQIKKFSQDYLNQGIFQYFQPVYKTNGVDLYLKDLEGLKRYKRRIDQPDYFKELKEKYFNEPISLLKTEINNFIRGIEKGLDWILENTNPFENFTTLEFCYSPSYKSFERIRTKEGYVFKYG